MRRKHLGSEDAEKSRLSDNSARIGQAKISAITLASLSLLILEPTLYGTTGIPSTCS